MTKQFEVEYTYQIEEGGSVILEADNVDHAFELGEEYVRETYDDSITNITIESAKEIVNT